MIAKRKFMSINNLFAAGGGDVPCWYVRCCARLIVERVVFWCGLTNDSTESYEMC